MKQLPRRLRRRLSVRVDRGNGQESGFTVAEFIIAMTLLVLVVTAMAQSFTGSIKVSGNVRQRVVATNLATETLEKLRAIANNPATFSNIAVTTSSFKPPPLDGTTFTVTQQVEWDKVGFPGTACDAGGNQGFLLRATVLVNWPGSATTVQSATLLAPPVGAVNTATGAVGIKVVTAAGTGSSGVTVTSNGTTSTSTTTSSDGCAFFDSLVPGGYTFTLSSATGVDGQENQISTTKTVSVIVGTTVENPPVLYDRGAWINYTYNPVLGPAPAGGMQVSVANGKLPQGFVTLPAATPLYPVFPYPDGYSLFAGGCSDANPLGMDSSKQPFYTAAAVTVIPVSPGGISVGTVSLNPLIIKVVNKLGVAVANPTLTAVANPKPVLAESGACPAAPPAYTLTAGDLNGKSSTGVGLGHLTLTATSGAKTGSVAIWVQPDGVWSVDATGAKASLIYPWGAPTFVPITVQ